jgi:branched-chain amino acid transport system ATP-binding protein
VAQLGIGYVPEDRRMFPGLTVRENFRLAALGARVPKAEQPTAQRRVLEVFPLLEPHLDRDASRLSGGQQQMVAVGRALICGTRLLLVDEITQGLAPIIASELGRTLRRVADEGLGVLLVEQNSQMALELADRVFVLDQGVVVTSGDAAEMRTDPSWMHEYLQL